MEIVTQEQIDAVGAKVNSLKEAVVRIDEMMVDLKNCSGNSTKSLILSAVKKQLSALGISV